jgi:hypothetical protein
MAPGWPQMMKRGTAALYCDLSVAEFEREVAGGRLPMPVKLGNSDHWSRTAIDEMLGQITGDTTPDWRKKSPLYGYGSAA